MMLSLVAPLLILQSGVAAASDVFLFPRSLSEALSRDKALGRQDSDRGLSALESTISEGMKSVALPDEQVRALQRLVSDARGSRDQVVRNAELPPTMVSCGFWQSGYRFSISGSLIGPKHTIYSSVSDEVTYQQLRGYWVNYNVARVFFAQGVRVRFRVRGGKPLFGRQSYRAYSWLAPPGGGDSKDELVYEHFGCESPILSFESPIRNRDMMPALQGALDFCDQRFSKMISDGFSRVEPVFIQWSRDLTKTYLSKSLPRI